MKAYIPLQVARHGIESLGRNLGLFTSLSRAKRFIRSDGLRGFDYIIEIYDIDKEEKVGEYYYKFHENNYLFRDVERENGKRMKRHHS